MVLFDRGYLQEAFPQISTCVPHGGVDRDDVGGRYRSSPDSFSDRRLSDLITTTEKSVDTTVVCIKGLTPAHLRNVKAVPDGMASVYAQR